MSDEAKEQINKERAMTDPTEDKIDAAMKWCRAVSNALDDLGAKGAGQLDVLLSFVRDAREREKYNKQAIRLNRELAASLASEEGCEGHPSGVHHFVVADDEETFEAVAQALMTQDEWNPKTLAELDASNNARLRAAAMIYRDRTRAVLSTLMERSQRRE